MANLQNRVVLAEIECDIARTPGTNMDRLGLPNAIEAATRAFVAVMRERGYPIETYEFKARYFYRASNGIVPPKRLSRTRRRRSLVD